VSFASEWSSPRTRSRFLFVRHSSNSGSARSHFSFCAIERDAWKKIPAARDSARAFPFETFPLTAQWSLALFAEIFDKRIGAVLHRRMLSPGVLLITVIFHRSHASVVMTLVGWL